MTATYDSATTTYDSSTTTYDGATSGGGGATVTTPYELNEAICVKAGTAIGRGSINAANTIAGSTNQPLVGALNIAAGNKEPNYRELAGVLNQLAGTTNLEAQAAASRWAGR
jgi:hypothetical protein